MDDDASDTVSSEHKNRRARSDAAAQPPKSKISYISRLPTDILLMIFRHLRTDIYAGFVLPQVSKEFRMLTHIPTLEDFAGLGLDKDDFQRLRVRNDKGWKLRCKANFAVAKRPDRTQTWEQTFRQLIKHRCLGCGHPTSSPFGRVWPEGVPWAKVCSNCQKSKGSPFRMMEEKDVLLLLEREEFAHLPYKDGFNWGWYYRSSPVEPIRWPKDWSWVREYHEGSVMKIYHEKQRVYMEKVETALLGYTGDRNALRTAIEYAGGVSGRISPILNGMIRSLISTHRPQPSVFSPILQHHACLLQLDKCLERLPIAIKASPMLGEYPRGMGPTSKAPHTWREALASKKRTVRQFIAAIDRSLLKVGSGFDFAELP